MLGGNFFQDSLDVFHLPLLKNPLLAICASQPLREGPISYVAPFSSVASAIFFL